MPSEQQQQLPTSEDTTSTSLLTSNKKINNLYIPSSIRKTLELDVLQQRTQEADQRYVFDDYLDDSDEGAKCFYERSEEDFKPVVDYLEKECYDKMRTELSSVTETDFIRWPESICKTGWTVFGLMAFGRELPENCDKCPFTAQVIRTITSKYGFEVSTAGFSCLKPGTHIVPHKGYEGYSDYVVRLHLGLVVPQPQSEAIKCSIRVGNEKRSWVQGQCLIFDDLLTHEAWNFSDQTRIILLVDLKYTKKSYLMKQPSNGAATTLQQENEEEEDMNPDCKNANFSRDLKGLLSSIDGKEGSEQDINKFFK